MALGSRSLLRWVHGLAIGVLVGLVVSIAMSGSAAPREVHTTIQSDGIGDIAVRITFPDRPRYAAGAPVLVDVPTFATPVAGYPQPIPVFLHGAVHVTFLWPGRRDAASGMRSDGGDDYGGPKALAALRDVILFAAGERSDTRGRRIGDLTSIAVETGNVGLYAFSHPGIPMTNVMAAYGRELSAVSYLVGGENPTNDALFSVEVGHWDEGGAAVLNPFYRFPEGYGSEVLALDDASVIWSMSPSVPDGRPTFCGAGGIEHALGSQVPRIFGKRIYSIGLLEALEAGGSLSADAWPDDLATLAEAKAWWPDRVAVGHYAAIGRAAPHLRVMLVFGVRDHVQPAADKPHIHQAVDGFRGEAGLWVRLNPDRAYVAALSPGGSPAGAPDNPAHQSPEDWRAIESWGVTTDLRTRTTVLVAGVLEMMDRTEAGEWRDDLERPLYPTRLP